MKSSVFFVWISLTLIRASGIDRTDKKNALPLFDINHPNVTYMTDKNFDQLLAQDKRPWLVDFYHPFCPHCREFVPDWLELTAYYKAEGSIRTGAVSCMDQVKCRRIGVTGFPTLVGFNFNSMKPGMHERKVGTHTIAEVKAFVDKLLREGKANATKIIEQQKKPQAPKVIEKPVEKKKWEESTLPSDQDTRINDAASAFMFGLKDGVFMGREFLEDVQIDALKEWLRVVSLTFPGSFNRQLITQLYEIVEPLPFLGVDAWEAIVKEWQISTVEQHKALGISEMKHLKNWERRSDLFDNDGNSYKACGSYTCGQWNLFHMMTINPTGEGMRSDNNMVAVIGAARRFMKHFFGCVVCRNHFLEANPLKRVQEIYEAKDKSRFLKMWLWKMHNSVNERLGHYQWPKPHLCPSCKVNGKWNEDEVEKWLVEWYGFTDVDLTSQKAWFPSLQQGVNKHISSTHKLRDGQPVPSSSIFVWYLLPVTFVGVYFFYVRPKRRPKNIHSR